MANNYKYIGAKFAYFLNAVYYCIWRGEIKSHKFFTKVLNVVLSILIDTFLPRKIREKIRMNQENSAQELDKFYYDRRNGFCIYWSDKSFDFCYSGYSFIILFPLWGLVIKLLGDTYIFKKLFVVVVFVIVGIVFFLWDIPVRRVIYSHKRYLEYFEQFDMEDKRWRQKWTMITWAFCVGGIVTAIAGIAIGMEIMIGWENIYLPFLSHCPD